MTSPTRTSLLAFIIVVSFWLGCNGPTEPEYVSEVMTAKIDGIRWNSTDENQYFVYSYYDVDLQYLSIAATKYGSSSKTEFISIVVEPYSTDTTYLLSNICTGRFSKRSANQIFTTTTNHTGFITIASLDTVARVASGTFAFSAIDSANKAVINVTDGRFRVLIGVD